MNFHEYQAKQLFADYGIPVPAGRVASTADEAVEAAKSLGDGPWMVKAQIHAGGRGKAGGVKFCKTLDDVKAAAGKMLGTKMATYQSAGVALPVNLVLVTTAGEIVKELYRLLGRRRGRGRALGVVELQRVPHQAAQHVDVHRLADEVEGAGLQRLHRQVHVAEGGDHGHRRLRVLARDLADQLDAAAVGQAHVGEAQVVAPGRQQLARLGQVGRRIHA